MNRDPFRPPGRAERGLSPQLIALYFQWFRILDGRILDLGCSVGSLGQHKPASTIRVCGMDLDLQCLRKARAYERVILGDFEASPLPLQENCFDGVLAKDVLEHVLRPWRLLAEIRRVLKPNGILILSVPLPYPWVVWDDPTHVRGFTRRALRALIEDAGFSLRSVRKMGGIPGFGRLGLVHLIPPILKIPPLGRLFASSWEAVAIKTSP